LFNSNKINKFVVNINKTQSLKVKTKLNYFDQKDQKLRKNDRSYKNMFYNSI